MHLAELPAAIRADVEFSVHAARTAGARVLALRATGRWSDSKLADVGDQAADGYIQGLVRGRYPADGILSEETVDCGERLAKERVWIVDPLDGTREYSQLREDWAVHVALVVGGRPVLGAVALPSQERVLWGVYTPTLTCGGLEGPGTISHGSDPTPRPVRIAMSRSHTPSWMPRFKEALGAELVLSGSVGNKVGLLLLGSADVYAHRRGLKEWDTCAPEVVARALGWHVSKLSGAEQRYNQADPRIDEFLCCRPADRERVIATLHAATAS